MAFLHIPDVIEGSALETSNEKEDHAPSRGPLRVRLMLRVVDRRPL